MPDVQSPDLQSVLESAQTIAVVGCSARPTRTSHKIARYMQDRGYRIVPVNPNYDEVLGEPCYPDLPSVPADVSIDIVDIFRAPRHTAEMVRTAIERVEQTETVAGERPVVWTQLGVSSPEAEELAAEAGLPYVRNRCIKVAYDRLLG
ncbi:MAG: CoA-binding protein [Salinivenus sp.]